MSTTGGAACPPTEDFPTATAVERALLMNNERVGALEDTVLALQKRVAELEAGMRSARFEVRDWCVVPRIGGRNSAQVILKIHSFQGCEERVAAAIAWAGLLPVGGFVDDQNNRHDGNVVAKTDEGARCVREIRDVIERLCGPENAAKLARIAQSFPHGPVLHHLLTSEYALEPTDNPWITEPTIVTAVANRYLRSCNTGASVARTHGDHYDGLLMLLYPDDSLEHKLRGLWSAIGPLFPRALVKAQHPADGNAVNFLKLPGPCRDLREAATAYAQEAGRRMGPDALRAMLAALDLC